VASQGTTREFLLSPTRDAEAAKRVFSKTLGALHTVAPRVSTVENNAASPKAFKELQAAGAIADACDLRPVTSLHNRVEQDHRVIKRLVKSGMGFFSLETAWRTLQGQAAVNTRRSGQIRGVGKGDIRSPVTFISGLFAGAV
jgi:transposase, IS6 family